MNHCTGLSVQSQSLTLLEWSFFALWIRYCHPPYLVGLLEAVAMDLAVGIEVEAF